MKPYREKIGFMILVCAWVIFMEEEISEKMILAIIMLAVFMVQFLVNWSVADAPFWPILMHEAGLSPKKLLSLAYTDKIS